MYGMNIRMRANRRCDECKKHITIGVCLVEPFEIITSDGHHYPEECVYCLKCGKALLREYKHAGQVAGNPIAKENGLPF